MNQRPNPAHLQATAKEALRMRNQGSTAERWQYGLRLYKLSRRTGLPEAQCEIRITLLAVTGVAP